MFTTEFADPDAARHAMNGVLIHDWLRSGQWLHSLQFARNFYSHFPAISIPYHPPLFPAAESLFYFAFGVHAWTARIAVACAVFAAAALLCAMVRRSHGSYLFALTAVAIVFFTPEFQRESSEVMLEMPSLALTLAALWFLRPDGRPLDWRGAIGFGLLAGAAIWTKQQCIFLAGVPFALIFFRRGWRELAAPPVWVGTLLLSAGAGVLTAWELAMGTGRNAEWAPFSLTTPFHNAVYYADALLGRIGIAAAIVLIGAGVAAIARSALRREREENQVYAAWALMALLLPLAMPFVDGRYLFNAYPPLIVLACDFAGRIIVSRRQRVAAAAAAVAILALAWHRAPESVRGTREAARWVMASHPRRILYLGYEDGDFIFAVRERDPNGQTFVIRGDKLAERCMKQDLGACASQLGVQYVVMEAPVNEPAFAGPAGQADRSMAEVQNFALSSPEHRFRGRLLVFRVSRPAPAPPVTLEIHSDLVKTGLQAKILP